jgi:cAMP-dependent protein kinase regulator
MNFYPRSATVKAITDCTVLEMLRNILDILRKNPRFRAQLDDIYCRRALETHLRAVPFFATLTPAFIRHLSDKITLVRSDPGAVIARQGEAATDFYLIRSGFVKVSQRHAGGELVLGYLSRGDFFGEAALLGGGARTAAGAPVPGAHTCAASAGALPAFLPPR